MTLLTQQLHGIAGIPVKNCHPWRLSLGDHILLLIFQEMYLPSSPTERELK